MQATGWLSVLGRIPPAKHDGLIIVTTTGAEIMLREIVRVENDFLIVRGRMTGSTDDGRVIIMPFDQITYFAFNKMLPEAEILAMFGKSAPIVEWKTIAAPTSEAAGSTPAFAQPPGPGLTPTAESGPAPASQGADTPSSEPTQPGVPPAGKAPARSAHPSKSMLLARLRARLANESGDPLPR